MSIFSELLPKLSEISNTITKNFNDDLKAVFECFDKLEEEYQNGKGRGREKAQKDKNPLATLQSIHEDEDEPLKAPKTIPNNLRKSSNKSAPSDTTSQSSMESNGDKPRRVSKKRSKNEVDGLSSPEQDKRLKRNASVKAQSIITKQVNVNLTQKMRREESTEKKQGKAKNNDADKENAEPVPVLQIKLEKVSLPPEAMDLESLPVNVEVKQEPNKDEIAMPPPALPVSRPRKAAAKEKVQDVSSEEETAGRSRRTTRTKKQTDAAPVAARSSCAAAAPGAGAGAGQGAGQAPGAGAGAGQAPGAGAGQAPQETRPKRTRGKKKVSETPNAESEKDLTQTSSQESAPTSPAEKPRPKRTRRGKKDTEKEAPKPEPIISPKEERISQPDTSHASPILQRKTKKQTKDKKNHKEDTVQTIDETDNDMVLEKTRIITNMNSTVTIGTEMDKTMVLPNGVYNHAPITPTNVRNMNETVVLETCNRQTMVLDKQQNAIMDATVVIEKVCLTALDPKAARMTDDNSLLTDDEDHSNTPPKQQVPLNQPTSAVKEKVQQFEEMASRVTRTKTRAMAKKEEETETQTPPDKIVKPILSAETLNKMNNMIFNGKAPQISSSASKPRANIVSTAKSFIPSSTSKLSAYNKAKEAEESLKREKEDARKKKEAMLEAKREQQKRKREEKMAAAAAAREAAEKDRRAAIVAAARDKMEKQAHADLGKLERLKEAERKRADQARKVAETEERRRAEEQARQLRLAEEQKRADAMRRKQLEEAEAMKKEAAIMAKEIEKRQKEYIEKQKLKNRSTNDKHHTPLKAPGTPCAVSHIEPVYMADGFQYLNSDEDEEPPERPVPAWSTSRARKQALLIQCAIPQSHIDRLFSVRVHSPDLRDIFPEIDRSRLKRTSSAVWRTPPGHRLPTLQE